MSYNAKVYFEQGAATMRAVEGGSVYFGNTQILFGAANPTGAAISASPGAVYFRSDGSASNFYVNVSDGTAGSVWASASISRP